jgi:hypothetical protein
VLDHAGAVHEVELIACERESRGRVRTHKTPRVAGTIDEVNTGDVQSGLERAQADLPAAEIENTGPGRELREREEARVTTRAGTRG